ncbi:MAG: pyridoxamine 5'-phosphate oxidase family protein [Patescibacteria group bacterium]
MKKLLEFLQSQKLVIIATCENGEPWVANVYYGVDANFKLYFVSGKNTRHSSHIQQNSHIAFSIVWFDRSNHKNRKAIQGLGQCRLAQNEEEIDVGVRLHNANFPEFAEKITLDWIHTNKRGSSIWIIEPSYMKYWDDELYGEDGSKEFTF